MFTTKEQESKFEAWLFAIVVFGVALLGGLMVMAWNINPILGGFAVALIVIGVIKFIRH
jgi:hypothetical protein